MTTLESPPLPLAIPAIQSSLASMESFIMDHWTEFGYAFDFPHLLGTKHITISFTSTCVVVEWVEVGAGGVIKHAKVTPWQAFLPWYVSRATPQTSPDAPGQ